MLQIVYTNEPVTITRIIPAELFPTEAIIRLVNAGVTVTINTAPRTILGDPTFPRILALDYGTTCSCEDL